MSRSGPDHASDVPEAIHGPGREAGGGGPASRPDLPAETVAVVGLGLMGGSLARALKSLDPAPRVLAMTTDPGDAEEALEVGAVDEIVDRPGGLSGADLVVYALPLSAFLDVLPAHVPWLEECVLTDVASLKVPVVEAMRAQGLGDRFVGAHPMTGGEGAGFRASRPTLYRGARIHLVHDSGSEEARDRVETFWRALGARPEWIGAAEHDRTMVWASHVPQLVANALARGLEGAGVDPADLGPGGRDMTRLAASSPAMWSDLVAHAAPLDAAALRVIRDELDFLARVLDERDFEVLEERMTDTGTWRRGGRAE